MGSARFAAGFRWGRFGVWSIVGAIALAFAFVAPALGTFGTSPSKECSSKDWNGEFWKADVDDHGYKVGKIETSSHVAKNEIKLTIDKYGKATWTLAGTSHYAVFRIYEKGGKYQETNSGTWLAGQGGTFTVKKSISHVTFCFKDVPAPKVAIAKTTNGADPTASDPNFIAIGESVKWSYEVRSTGNVPLKDVVVSDNDPGVTPSFVSGDDGDGLLEPGEKWLYQASGQATLGSWNDGFAGYTNTGTVSAQSKLDPSANGHVEASDTSGYYGSDPSIHIKVSGPTAPVLVGSTFDWKFTVSNDGNVPLAAAVVKEDGSQVGNCAWTVLLPGQVVECTLTEVATPGQETSTFVASGVFDNGESQTVISETISGVSYETNHAPVANDDTYEVDERDAGGVITLEITAPGVLGNDDDADSDPLTAGGATTPTNGGMIALDEDGSFDYTPSESYVWSANELSREDTFEYTVSDGRGGTDVGTVTINVVRQLCVTDSVSSPAEQNVTATFTLQSFEGCKDWPMLDVETQEASVDGTVLFQPPLQDGNGEYVGQLTVYGVDVDFSDLDEIVLKYDPSGGDTYELVPSCEGNSESPSLPGSATTGWCFYDVDFDLNAGLWDVTWFVYGIDDPKFVFK